ncbi:hypothetical protein O3M35_001257 [Rhynocoris fuscipes]|uniref:tRNA-dihydrouridine(20a/20b) synthase [NAD(P)+] n=1 Tax=Rhynocoris fuscipes TaxID=488301 RepID=A0AAW1DRF9_9HEMI
MMTNIRENTNILHLFNEKSLVKVSAPMVRYSKLEFRSLVRKYGADLCFTPMIMADSFVKSMDARNNEFTTNKDDIPLVVQFAANSVNDFVSAAELISPHSDGIDLNCGCPQRWAMQEGYGAAMLKKSELIRDMVRQVKNRIRPDFTVSVKVRLLDTVSKSVELCRSIEAAGASFITVHGRTVNQRSDPVNTSAIRNIVQSVSIPVVANGGVRNMSDVLALKESTKSNGVMVAQGLLTNPALFTGVSRTPLSCIQDWIDIAISSDVQFQCFHHHLVFMLEKVFDKEQRRIFNKLSTRETVLEFLKENLGISLNDQIFSKSFIEYNDCYEGNFFKSKIIDLEMENNENDAENYLEDSIFCF